MGTGCKKKWSGQNRTSWTVPLPLDLLNDSWHLLLAALFFSSRGEGSFAGQTFAVKTTSGYCGQVFVDIAEMLAALHHRFTQASPPPASIAGSVTSPCTPTHLNHMAHAHRLSHIPPPTTSTTGLQTQSHFLPPSPTSRLMAWSHLPHSDSK